ncbi:hypothetical protein F4818DRAFT_350988 [Hypoxylon cercidicola]|nr:hypothetical protein F4818DRAFT_350988 [Hypoxylon cercidicola]
MDKTGPPSPASSTNNPSATSDDVLQSQLQQLIQHNASAPPTDVHSQISSNPHSRYSSPAPQSQHMSMPVYDQGPYGTAPAPTYGGYQQHQHYQMENSPYPQLPDTGSSLTPHNAYSTPATSPPTPLQRIDGMTMRSGREINNNRASSGTPLGPNMARIEKSSPKPRSGAGARKAKKRKGKSDKPPAVVLDAPLSVLVKDITSVQDTDIAEYVNRSPDTRQNEVRDSKDLKVKRPMNAFMLYRKAFQNRTKEWKKHDNHQVISQICGVGWNMEERELKDQFDEWARIERENHKRAFPDYKFAPAKAKSKKSTSSGSRRAEHDDDDGSDLGNYNWEDDESGPPTRNASRNAGRLYDPEADYRPPGMRSYTQYQHQSPVMHSQRLPYPPHQSSFQYSNPGKPRPAEYGASLGQNQYYQQTSDYMTRPHYPHHMPYGPGGMPGVPSYVENVYMNKANSPANSFHSSPVDHYGDMMGSAYPPPPPQQPQVAMPHTRIHDPHPIDPSLMGHQGHPSQFDALGILGIGDQTDTMPQYLDHSTGDVPIGHGGQTHFEPSMFQQSTSAAGHETSPTSAESTWHDDHPLPKFEGGEWEKFAVGEGEFRYEDLNEILDTTNSPAG